MLVRLQPPSLRGLVSRLPSECLRLGVFTVPTANILRRRAHSWGQLQCFVYRKHSFCRIGETPQLISVYIEAVSENSQIKAIIFSLES